MQYNAPVSSDLVLETLAPSLSPVVLSAIQSVLERGASEGVNVGFMQPDGILKAPWDEKADVVLVNVAEQHADVPVNINLPDDAQIDTARVFVFNTDAPMRVSFDEAERVIAMGNGSDRVEVSGDADVTLDGGHGNDTLTTGGGDDLVIAGTGDNIVSTGAGDDTILSGLGNDTIDGGTGFDVIEAVGDLDDWDIEIVDGALVLTQGADYSITATNVEFIQLDDAAISVVATQEEATALRLYEALLGRTADREGAEYWVDDVNQDGGSTHGVAASFLASDEFQARGDLSDEEFVELLYTHALHRDADDAGLQHWVDGMQELGHTRADVAIAIVGSAEAADVLVTVQVLDDLV